MTLNPHRRLDRLISVAAKPTLSHGVAIGSSNVAWARLERKRDSIQLVHWETEAISDDTSQAADMEGGTLDVEGTTASDALRRLAERMAASGEAVVVAISPRDCRVGEVPLDTLEADELRDEVDDFVASVIPRGTNVEQFQVRTARSRSFDNGSLWIAVAESDRIATLTKTVRDAGLKCLPPVAIDNIGMNKLVSAISTIEDLCQEARQAVGAAASSWKLLTEAHGEFPALVFADLPALAEQHDRDDRHLFSWIKRYVLLPTGLFVALALSIRMGLHRSVEGLHQDLELVAPSVEQLEVFQTRLANTEERLINSTAQVNNRTAVATLIEAVVRNLPDGVRLERIQASFVPSQIRIEGSAVSDSDIALLLKSLEAMDGNPTVMLEGVGGTSASDTRRRASGNKFTIAVSWS